MPLIARSFFVFFALLFATVAWGAESPSAENQTAEDASKILQRACQRIAAADAFSLEFEYAIRIGFPGLDHGKFARYEVAARRPNKFAFVRRKGDMGTTIVSDGENITNYVAELKQYTQQPAPKTLEKFSNSLTGAMMLEGGMGGFAMALLADAPYQRLTEGDAQVEYVDKEVIEGKECHRLRLQQEDLKFDIWVTAAEEPTLRRIRPDMSSQFTEEELASGFKIVISLDYTKWDWKPEADAAVFQFSPPATADLVDEVSPRMPEPVLPPVRQVHELLGQPAPKFALVTLAGDEAFELGDVLGKQVVVLDFWASWCAPCIKSLPKLAKLTEKFADENVVFYGVNLEEDTNTVQEFLEKQEIELPVLLDMQAAVAGKYGVDAIPHMVLIGLDGRVQVVHTGAPDDFEGELTRQLTALLAGEDLAAKELAEAEGTQPHQEQPQDQEQPHGE